MLSSSIRSSTSLLLHYPTRSFQIHCIFTTLRSMADAGPAHKHTNRLVHEHSPYLLQHAHNPVDWYPWGEDAFSKAKKDDKPIFLSGKYRCHVMEVESFENEEVARYLNAWFVSIKVDREERPDVDKVYMTFVQASQGGGGWPMSVFLTPELTPIVGGTYFPPHDNYGRPGFKTVLRRVKESWESKKDMLRQAGDTVIQQLASSMSSSASALEVKEGLAQQAVQLCVSQLSKGFDPKLGGFGSAPKFPRPVEIILMLQRYYRLNQTNTDGAASKVLEMALFSLRCMARGGIHDHIGGGFHRYSVDEYWHVPHFEKMLYDQAQLVNVYLDAFSITANTVYASVARDTLDYLIRDMTHPEGGIYSAEDADSAISHESSQKKEGLFYVWTSKEIEDVLGKELSEIFTAHYNIKPEGNCTLSQMSDLHHEFVEKNVLIERQDISETANKFGKSVDETFEILGECRKRLHVYRTKRPRPHLDDKVIVAWNGLAMSSFARASTILKSEPKGQRYQFPVAGCDPEEYLKAAKGIAKFIKENVYDNKTKRLQRSFRNGPSQAPGFLDDYAFLIAGLIDLYQACGDINYLNWAVELQTTQDECFLDMNGGGYFSTAEGDPSILLRNKEDYDGAEPSANSVSALNLLRFSSLFANEDSKRYRDTAQHLLAVFEKRVEEVAIAVPLMCCAFDSLSTPKSQVVICGRRGTAELNALLVAAHKTFDPDRIVIQINVDDVGEKEWWKMKNRMVFEMTEKVVAGQAVAFVCRNFICRPPITDSLALEDELKR